VGAFEEVGSDTADRVDVAYNGNDGGGDRNLSSGKFEAAFCEDSWSEEVYRVGSRLYERVSA
jgi:hypothetical protein